MQSLKLTPEYCLKLERGDKVREAITPFCQQENIQFGIISAGLGGHLVECLVSATVEVYLRSFQDPITRIPDEPTGLKLMDLHSCRIR